MDLKTFSGHDFNPKKWINNAWGTSGNQEKEVFVANTVSRLQLYMKQLTNSLDETTTQIVTSVPRILQDASALQIEGALLQEKLQALESKVQGVEEQTGQSIQSLQRIDQLKSRLENAASALREADKWAALATSLEDILEAGVPSQADKLKELAEQVAAMTASLEVLSDAPDYENKQLQLETLYNRLEAAISPPLIEALTQMDAERASRYVAICAGMGRGASAARCWRRAAAARLAAAWRRCHTHTLPELTRLLASEADRQVDWLTNVLKSDTPLTELIKLYTDLLLSLEPSPTKIVSASLKLCSSPEEGINLLMDLKRDIDEFITCISNVINTPRSNKEELPTPILKELGLAVYAPLRELLDNYTELQSQMLLAQLKDNLVQQDDLLEQSRSFLAVSEKCDKWLTAAYSNARKIGGDAIYPYYAPAVETFITALASQLSAHSRRIESVFLSTANSGRVAGVLSSTFPAALTLQAAVDTLLETVTQDDSSTEEPTSSPLYNLPELLLEPEVLKQLPAKRTEPRASLASLRRAHEHLRGLARAVLRHPVDTQLEKIPTLPVWSNNDAMSTDLPDFAVSPQEYITEIGQYLMTLPQHLEMHLSEKQAPLQFLSDVCTHTCEVYAEKILNIRNMDALGTKRCLTDIVYLSSVVEDLGTSITPALKNLEKSLRAATPQTAE